MSEREGFSTASTTDSGSRGKEQVADVGLERALARDETRAIFRLKLLLVSVLVGVAVGVGMYAHRYARDVQVGVFDDTFESQGTKLVRGFYEDSFQKLQAMESLSSSITFLFRNETWPFVTIPYSHAFFGPFLTLSSAASIKFLPIVAPRQRLQWEQHVLDNQNWIEEANTQQSDSSAGRTSFASLDGTTRRMHDSDFAISPYIKSYVGVDTSPGVWTPFWQYSPVVPNNNYFINFNQLLDDEFQQDFPILAEKKNAVIAKTESYQEGLDFQSTRDLKFTEEVLRIGGYGTYEPGEPVGFLHYPVFEDVQDREKVVAILTATVYWKSYFQNILPESARGIICVIENEEQQFTYKIDGNDATFLGNEDLHDPKYDSYEITARGFDTSAASVNGIRLDRTYTGVPIDESRLSYRIRVYPSQEMADLYLTNEPSYYAILVASGMFIAVIVFGVYDWYVERRQKKVSTVAIQSNAIVNSLFPKQIKNKLYSDRKTKKPVAKRDVFRRNAGKVGFQSSQENALQPTELDGESDPVAPIADFFPSATVLFMDISGFTAWSSLREPSQVFILLETLFRTFDRLAPRRRVFKVETIGDCYLAVCGLPEPCQKHAANMASFARDCLEQTSILAHQLIPTLGPETGELTMRIGLHSGPVTAGVLRGERARFQLFGDTVNTASRMESTGKEGCIQCSEECAEELRSHFKGSWLKKREDKIQVKGKGEMQTYWIQPKVAPTLCSESGKSNLSTPIHGDAMEYMLKQNELEISAELEPKLELYADFNYDILLKSLKAIISKRNFQNKASRKGKLAWSAPEIWSSNGRKNLKSCLDEVVEYVELPNYRDQPIDNWENLTVEIPHKVKDQLKNFCRKIATLYKKSNPFHNFEHASHVTQSSAKLLSRIVSIRDSDTFGISADPLTQFAVLFSSMIHDVDHRGVPNTILAQEYPSMANLFQNQAIAEQNSVELAWGLLMEPYFSDLQHTIYANSTEQQRFRNLVVNCVLATDIFDQDLKAMREKRWQAAFHPSSLEEDKKVQSNRKATIVIENIIQASDVCHTMQHWHVYQKWNQRLFNENYKAYVEGRAKTDPTNGWYDGELWFFDNYVIPLAKKLEECQIFGVSSDEYLLYAKANREEWEKKGHDIVSEYAAR